MIDKWLNENVFTQIYNIIKLNQIINHYWIKLA